MIKLIKDRWFGICMQEIYLNHDSVSFIGKDSLFKELMKRKRKSGEK